MSVLPDDGNPYQSPPLEESVDGTVLEPAMLKTLAWRSFAVKIVLVAMFVVFLCVLLLPAQISHGPPPPRYWETVAIALAVTTVLLHILFAVLIFLVARSIRYSRKATFFLTALSFVDILIFPFVCGIIAAWLTSRAEEFLVLRRGTLSEKAEESIKYRASEKK